MLDSRANSHCSCCNLDLCHVYIKEEHATPPEITFFVSMLPVTCFLSLIIVKSLNQSAGRSFYQLAFFETCLQLHTSKVCDCYTQQHPFLSMLVAFALSAFFLLHCLQIQAVADRILINNRNVYWRFMFNMQLLSICVLSFYP